MNRAARKLSRPVRAVVLAILVHVAVGALLGLSLRIQPKVVQPGVAKPVQAIVIDRSAIAAEKKKAEEKKRQEIEKKRRAEEKKQKEQAADKERKKSKGAYEFSTIRFLSFCWLLLFLFELWFIKAVILIDKVRNRKKLKLKEESSKKLDTYPYLDF